MPRQKTSRSSIPPGCADRRLLLQSILRDSAYVPPPKPGSYEVSYPEFLAYFRNVESLDRHHLIIAANFSYGWMPTILDFRSESFDQAVEYLQRSRSSDDLDADELATLASVVNNSIVGASKLLHFASPTRFAIWDSRVAKYLGASIKYLGANQESARRAAEQYVAYNECCRSLSISVEASAVTGHVSSVIGYRVHPMRALELVMYHGGLNGHSYAAISAPAL